MQPQAHGVRTEALTPVTVFEYAPLVQQIVILALILAILAAVIVLAAKLWPGAATIRWVRIPVGTAIGRPIVGLLGACHAGLYMTIAVATVPIEPTLKMFAPGIAESFEMVGLGFLAGAMAVVAHWAIESRIDWRVLGA